MYYVKGVQCLLNILSLVRENVIVTGLKFSQSLGAKVNSSVFGEYSRKMRYSCLRPLRFHKLLKHLLPSNFIDLSY